MARKSPKFEGSIICEVCGKETPRRGTFQKYCPDCSAQKDRERKLKWARANPPDPDELNKKRAQAETRRKSFGVEISTKNKAKMHWPAEQSEADDLIHLVRVSVPFSYGFSKNSIWSLGNRGHVYARKEANALREQLAWKINNVQADWYEGKVWIDIFVEKPDMRGDAINVIDLVCDAVKDAIGIDDRWFCIRRLDWAVVKKDPKIYVGVGQAIDQHHRVCSKCGKLLPLSEFGNNKSVRLGKSRECKECQTMLRKIAKEKDKPGCGSEGSEAQSQKQRGRTGGDRD